MDFDRPLDPPEDSGYYIYRIARLDGTTGADGYRTERDALEEIEAMVESRLAEYRLLCEAEADEEALENGEPVRVFTDAELRDDLRDEYEVVEEEDEDGDPDRDDWRYGA
jgi:hypothetical protein